MSETDRDLVAENAEEIEDRRLRDIFEARKNVREAKSGLGEIARRQRPSEYLSAYRSQVEAYLIEVEPLFLSTGSGKKIWYNRDFGSVKIEPPIRWEDPASSTKTSRYVVEGSDGSKWLYDKPDPKYAPLEGASSILEYDNPITASWEVTVRMTKGLGRTGQRSETVSNVGYIPQKTLDKVVRSVNTYLSELNIGIDLEEESDPLAL